MSTRMIKITSILVMISMSLGLFTPIGVSAVASTVNRGELVDFWSENDHTFIFTEESQLFVVATTEPSGELLQVVQLLQRQFTADGYSMSLVWGDVGRSKNSDIVIELDPASGIESEGYRLEVTDKARIVAADMSGLLYGGNQLLKQLRISDAQSLRGFVCEDTPDTRQRVVSLDCGRKYYTKNWICNFIRELSWMGYNALELHFSDDSGFRIDLWDEAYYTDTFQPENDFSWICGSNYASWTLAAYKNDPDQGKYLTTAEVVEILQTAKEYRIDIIPAFDSPSHLDYLTWIYEQNFESNPDYHFYSGYDHQTYYAEDVKGVINYTNSSGWSTPLKWPYYSAVDVCSDHAKAFVFELYQDIADFFKTYAGSSEFSIGADEVNLNTDILESGYGFTWGFADFVMYINDLNALLNQKGYTVRMYNDFVGSTTYQASSYNFADNIDIMYWDSPFEPNTGRYRQHTEPVSYYVDKGIAVFNCIQTNTYYTLRVTADGSDARSVHNRQWTFYHSNEKMIYEEWCPANFSEHGDFGEHTEDVPFASLGGGYFLIWCDYASVSSEVELWNGCYDTTSRNTGELYSLRDRMWSNITKMWNWDVNEMLSFEEFTQLRDQYGDFPGCSKGINACSEVTILPETVPITAAYATENQSTSSGLWRQHLYDIGMWLLPWLRNMCIFPIMGLMFFTEQQV